MDLFFMLTEWIGYSMATWGWVQWVLLMMALVISHSLMYLVGTLRGDNN